MHLVLRDVAFAADEAEIRQLEAAHGPHLGASQAEIEGAVRAVYRCLFHPLMRAAALSRLGRANEAKEAVDQLLALEPDFSARGKSLISRYVKVDELIEMILEGLHKAGLTDLT